MKRDTPLIVTIILLGTIPTAVIYCYALMGWFATPAGSFLVILITKACTLSLAGALLFPKRVSLPLFLLGAAQLISISAVDMLINGVSMPPTILSVTALSGAGVFVYLYSRANARLESHE